MVDKSRHFEVICVHTLSICT